MTQDRKTLVADRHGELRNESSQARANGSGQRERGCGITEPVTVERIERDIRIVADVMVKHNRPGLIVTIKRLEAERDRLRNETDPIAYARQILAKSA